MEILESPPSKFKTLNSNLNLLNSIFHRLWPTPRSATTTVIGLLFLLCSCRCPDPVLIDLGPVPDSILAKVPYQNGLSYKLRHSAGLTIDFNASRDSRYEQTWCEEWCCDYVYKYQVNTTTLHSDYPVFDLRLSVSNQNMEYPFIDFVIGTSSFYLPLNPGDYAEAGFTDSLLIDNHMRYNVFKIKTISGGYPLGPIFADSLFYNFSEGIIRIIMSNGEYYAIAD